MKNLILFCLIAAAAASIARPRAADPLQEALQKGLVEEEANQNLTGAIQAYRSIQEQFQEQRKIVATATFRLGECFRKQGKTNEAFAEFQRVARDFKDQASLVQLSEKYLAERAGSMVGTSGRRPSGNVQPSLNPEQAKLLQEEIALVRKQLEGKQRAFESGKAATAEIIQVQRELLQLERQLPENASSAQQRVLIDREIGQVEQLLAESKKRVETGQATPLDDIPLRRDLLKLQRQRLAAEAAGPAVASSSFQTRLQQIVRPADGSETTETGGAQSQFQQRLNSIVRRAAESNPTADEEDREVERIRQMIQNSPDLINAQKGPDGDMPLHGAVKKGQLTVVEFLLTNRANINARNYQDITPLHFAASAGHKTMVELLLDRGAAVDATDKNGKTPLHEAAGRGFQAVAEVLLARGAPIDAQRPQGTPLMSATGGRHEAMMEFLLAKGAKVDVPDNWGVTPLMAAAQSGQQSLVQLLVKCKAKVNLRDEKGVSTLNRAVQNKNDPLIKLLLEHGADPNVAGNFFRTGDLDVNVPIGTPLAYAAFSGRTSLVELLLQHAANPDIPDSQGRTALHWAVVRQNEPLVRLLLEKSANPNLEDNDGRLPIYFALDRPTGVPSPGVRGNSSGRAPVVADSVRIALIKLLLEHGAEVNKVTFQGTSPLFEAVSTYDTNLVALLLTKSAEPNLKGGSGLTPLHLAAAMGAVSMIELLVQHGADVNAKDEYGNTPLHYAAFKSSKPAVQTLLTHGAKLNIANEADMTPQQAASEQTVSNSVTYYAVPILARASPENGNRQATSQLVEVRDYLRQQLDKKETSGTTQ